MGTYREIKTYIDHNPLAIVSTISSEGTPHGAVVYACADSERPVVYFITKQETKKYQNLREHSQVSLTIVNPAENSTLQADGRAFDVADAITIDMVMTTITQKHASATEWLPPIAKLRAGAYTVVGVELAHARLARFEGMDIGDERIFTRL